MKKWELTFSTFDGGYTKSFYTIKGALVYLRDKCIYDKCFVDLENKKEGFNIRLYVPEEKYNYTLGLQSK